MATERYVDAAAGGGGDGSSWAQAFNSAEFLADLAANGTSDYYYYVRGGTYTFAADCTVAGAGTDVLPAKIVGVASGTTNAPPTVADWPTFDNRPLFAMQGYELILNTFWEVYNVRATGSDIECFSSNSGGFLFNVAVNNSAGDGFNTTGAVIVYVGCDGTASDTPFESGSSDFRTLVACYAHDAATGIDLDLYSSAIACVVDDMSSMGINFDNHDACVAAFCTINDCTDGIGGSTPGNGLAVGCCITGNSSVGIDMSSSSLGVKALYCAFASNGANVNNIPALANWGYGCITTDPGYGNPVNDEDFTVSDGDNADDVCNICHDLTGVTLKA